MFLSRKCSYIFWHIAVQYTIVCVYASPSFEYCKTYFSFSDNIMSTACSSHHLFICMPLLTLYLLARLLFRLSFLADFLTTYQDPQLDVQIFFPVPAWKSHLDLCGVILVGTHDSNHCRHGLFFTLISSWMGSSEANYSVFECVSNFTSRWKSYDLFCFS